EVSRTVTGGVGGGRVGGEGAAVVLRAEIAVVVAGGIVVLIAARLDAHADVMQSTLPSQVVDVAVGVVDEIVAVVGRGAHAAQIAIHALVRKAVIGLVGKG